MQQSRVRARLMPSALENVRNVREDLESQNYFDTNQISSKSLPKFSYGSHTSSPVSESSFMRGVSLHRISKFVSIVVIRFRVTTHAFDSPSLVRLKIIFVFSNVRFRSTSSRLLIVFRTILRPKVKFSSLPFGENNA